MMHPDLFTVSTIAGIRLRNRLLRSGAAPSTASPCRAPSLSSRISSANCRMAARTASRCINCNYCAIMIEQGPLRCRYGKLPKR